MGMSTYISRFIRNTYVHCTYGGVLHTHTHTHTHTHVYAHGTYGGSTRKWRAPYTTYILFFPQFFLTTSIYNIRTHIRRYAQEEEALGTVHNMHVFFFIFFYIGMPRQWTLWTTYIFF